jgi:ABC-type dipeptide/oligopeptide/nickel transport system permease component
MTKKVSIVDSAKQKLVEKEKFIYGFNESKTDTNKLINKQTNKSVKQETHKAMVYIPQPLWVKYNNYRYELAKQGKSVSFNKMVLEFLEKKLEKF